MNDKIQKHPDASMRQNDYENPFAANKLADHVSHGTVEIESQRAIAQIQAKVLMAKRFPRDKEKAFNKTIEACSSLTLAEEALYAYPRGNTIVNGGTIRLAEELMNTWGNVDASIVELGRRDGETELKAEAWDMENNVSSAINFTVKHNLDAVGGSEKEVTKQRDVRDLTANISSRKLRGRIFAVLPEALVRAAINKCHETLALAVSADIENRRAAVIGNLKEYGVAESSVLKYFNKNNASYLDANDVTKLIAIYKTIKNGDANAREIFEQGMTSKQVQERKKQTSPHQAKETPRNTTPSRVEEPNQTKKEQQEAQKPTQPKKGTLAWYRAEIEKRGQTPAGKRVNELQAQYQKILEAELRESRTGEKTESEPVKESPPALVPEVEEPPATDIGDDDDLFAGDFFEE